MGFVAVTMAAVLLQNVNFLSTVPEGFRLYLGQPPSPHLIGILLSAYFVSSAVISCHGIIAETRPGRPWTHLALLSAFYFLYFCADALNENLIAVFIAGLVLSALEHLRGWAHQRRTRSSR